MRHVLCGVLFSICGAMGVGAQGPAAFLQFSLDWDGPPRAQYTIRVEDDGTGVYVPRVADAALDGKEPGGKVIHIGPALVKKLFAAVPMVEGGRCETHNKGIAKTGAKALLYAGHGRDGHCAYNYSDDDRVNEATAGFEAIAATMQYGDRLASKLRFDRLGLDTEIDGLQSAVAEGRALEVENIAPVLQAISDDERVMDRVRRKAGRLLQGAGVGQTAAEADSSAR